MSNSQGLPGESPVPSLDDHRDLAARTDAARALSDLAHAMVAHRADAEHLRTITDAARRMTTEIAAQPERLRLEELAASPRFTQARRDHSLAELIDDGAFVDLFHDSPVSGSANPLGMGLRLRRDGDQVVGAVTLGAGWEGPPGRAHGGVVAACVDETIGGLLPVIGTMAFTARLTLNYRQPCPLHVPIEFRAYLVRRDGRKLFIECHGSSSGNVFVESEALFIAVDLADIAPADPASRS